MSTQVCTGCKIDKPLSSFHKEKRCRLGVRGICNSCKNAKQCARYKLNPESMKRYQTVRLYGMAPAEIEIKKDLVGRKCQICIFSESGITRGLFVDHDHETGKFRGILCHSCNILLGFFNDGIDLINKAMVYLISGPIIIPPLPALKRKVRHESERRLHRAKQRQAKRYNLTVPQLEHIFEQKKNCEICGSTKLLGIDHNHVTNMVRGVLCRKCNAGLGSAKDRIEVLSAAEIYLLKSKTVRS
jgi:hypothetical protein